MTTTLRVAGTLLAADPGSRSLPYRLLPYGEPGRTNLGVLTASRGTVRLPDNPADIVLNLEHDRTRPVAICSALDDRDDALYATFEALPTTAGDDLLVEARAGVRPGISVELDQPVIRAGRLLSSALGEAGAVRDSAFPNAQLVAADTGDDTPADDTGDTTDADDNPTDQGEDDDDTADDTADDTGDSTDTDSTDDSGADMTTTTTTSPAAAGTATVTASRAAAPAGLPARNRRTDPSFRDVVRFLAARSRGHLDGRLYAALSDITPAATSVNDITQVPQWLGELWDGREYRQRFLPLLSHQDLTEMEIKGWKWTVKPEVGDWAGNKADVPSNVPTTEPYVLTPHRIAGAHDIDRIFRDFGVESFWTSYWQAMTESYSRQADAAARDFLLDNAPYVAPGTVPAGVSKAAAYIVDGAIAIIDVAVPTFAVVSKDLYRDLLLTRADDLLAYLNMALGLEEGSISSFSVVPGDATVPADTVVVGAREAGTIYELPGASPVRVEALNIAQGGVDVGLFGYMAEGLNDDGGLALVSGTAPVVEEIEEEAAPAKKRTRRVRKAAAKAPAETSAE